MSTEGAPTSSFPGAPGACRRHSPLRSSRPMMPRTPCCEAKGAYAVAGIGRHHHDAAGEGGSEEAGEERIVGAAEAEVEHLRVLEDGEVDRLGEGVAVADRLALPRRLLPAGL